MIDSRISFRHRWWQPYPGDRFPYCVMRVLWICRVIGTIPRRSRPLWLWNALTYRYEICFDCGGKVMGQFNSWWSADDALWLEVMGSPDGVVCPGCFTRRCDALGIHVHWQPVRDERKPE